jgi:hypothetical protein
MEDFHLRNNKGTWMNETLLKYLAGIIDADGSISFGFYNPSDEENPSYNMRLTIHLGSSSSVDVHGFVESLPEITGFGSKYTDTKPKVDFTTWTVTSRRDLEMLVPRLVKHMVVKGSHLQRMFDKWKEYRGLRLSADECDRLRSFNKESRAKAGPVKAKNHPSYAWLAGYLDGNGSYRIGKCKAGTYKGKQCYRQQCSINVACHKNDAMVLDFIQKAHGGYQRPHSRSENCMVWERSLGKSQSSFALRFLPKLVKHARIKKYKIEQMISFHHQQRLNISAPKGEAIV